MCSRYLDVTPSKEVLHQGTVGSAHASMVNGKPMRQDGFEVGRLLDADTDVLLGQGAGPEAVVKVEQPLVWLHTQEGCHILVVGQAYLNLPDSPGNNAFQHRASVVVKKVDLINDQQPHFLGVGPVTALTRDDVPLLRGGHNDLRLLDL
ncbi:MAG: hypothetical protein FRX49_12303 [Trebouxia sp. A1-2]|nr:MAG: hypothetical protein FRX49_12303 [Trebouxia sp. A1-2]